MKLSTERLATRLHVSTVPMDCWNIRWLGVRFDPSSGRGRIHLHPRDIRGLACWTRGQWHALWNDNGRICLQVGPRKWYADEGSVASIREDGRDRVFRLVRGSDCQLEHRYVNPNVRWWNKFDVSRDDLDDLMGDFFLWATRIWSDKNGHRNFIQGAWRRSPPPLKSLP
jgi:hypothetical protein